MWAAIIPAAIGLIGQLIAKGDRDSAEALRQQMMQEFQGIELPGLDDIDKILIENPEILKFNEDPQLRQAQIDALSSYRGIAKNNGQDAQFKAGMADALDEAGRAEKRIHDANMTEMSQRGMSGSNMELANSVLGNQSVADRTHMLSLQQEAEAQKRKDAALAALAGLSGKVRDQDFGFAKAKSDAKDSVDRFNAGLKNDAIWKGFQGQMDLARGRAGVFEKGAGYADQSADRTQNTWSNIGEVTGHGIDAYNKESSENSGDTWGGIGQPVKKRKDDY